MSVGVLDEVDALEVGGEGLLCGGGVGGIEFGGVGGELFLAEVCEECEEESYGGLVGGVLGGVFVLVDVGLGVGFGEFGEGWAEGGSGATGGDGVDEWVECGEPVVELVIDGELRGAE